MSFLPTSDPFSARTETSTLLGEKAASVNDLWSDSQSPLGAVENVVAREKAWTSAVGVLDKANQLRQLGSEAVQTGQTVADHLLPTPAANAANQPVKSIQNCQCPPPGSAVDISRNDLINFAGAVVNLPLAIVLKVVAEVVPGFGDVLFDNLYTKFGTGDHTGVAGVLGGDASRYADPEKDANNPTQKTAADNDPGHHEKNAPLNQGDTGPGILGIAMGLSHLQGFGDTELFEQEQYCHNIATLPGEKSKSEASAIQTLGEGVGIFAKHIYAGPWLSGLVNGTDENGNPKKPDDTTGFAYGLYIGAKDK